MFNYVRSDSLVTVTVTVTVTLTLTYISTLLTLTLIVFCLKFGSVTVHISVTIAVTVTVPTAQYLHFDPLDLDAPGVRRLVQRGLHPVRDLLPLRQDLGQTLGTKYIPSMFRVIYRSYCLHYSVYILPLSISFCFWFLLCLCLAVSL